MNGSKRKRICIFVFTFMLVGLLVLTALTLCKRHKDIDDYMKSFARTCAVENVSIKTADGETLYTNGEFHEDPLVREAFFHITGDDFKSIPNSILGGINYDNMVHHSAFTGYSVDSQEIKLNIDSQLQVNCYQALKKSPYNGCVVVLDYTNGAIKAMVSTPSLDPLHQPENPEDGSYLCKATSLYCPGSVFKPVTAACMLEKNASGVSNAVVNCNGFDGEIRCFQSTSHGHVDLTEALHQSCNIGIGTLAFRFLTPTDLNGFAERCGVLNPSADFPISRGTIDAKENLKWTANGQGKDLIAPLSLASYYCALANGGKQSKIRMYQNTKSSLASIMKTETALYIQKALEPVASEAWEAVEKDYSFTAFSKTGTAEVGDRSHCWFTTGLMDENMPSYVILTFLEYGEKTLNAKMVTSDVIDCITLKE